MARRLEDNGVVYSSHKFSLYLLLLNLIVWLESLLHNYSAIQHPSLILLFLDRSTLEWSKKRTLHQHFFRYESLCTAYSITIGWWDSCFVTGSKRLWKGRSWLESSIAGLVLLCHTLIIRLLRSWTMKTGKLWEQWLRTCDETRIARCGCRETHSGKRKCSADSELQCSAQRSGQSVSIWSGLTNVDTVASKQRHSSIWSSTNAAVCSSSSIWSNNLESSQYNNWQKHSRMSMAVIEYCWRTIWSTELDRTNCSREECMMCHRALH